MPGKAYPPPGLPFGFDPVGPASATPPGNRHLRVIYRPPVRGSYPSHTTLCRSAAGQWPERPLPAGRRAASVANFYPVHASRFAAGSMHLGINQPRTHAVYSNPLRRHFQRQPGRQGIYRPFRRGIVNVLPGAPRRDAADDTLTIAPPLPPCRCDMRFTASRQQRK